MLSAITTGHAEREDALCDEAVAGADPVAAVEHEQDAVDVLERRVDRALHVLRERVARPLEAGQVGEHELVAVAVRDPEDAPPRRLRLVRDDRDLAAAERVDERRLADVRPPRDGDEAATSQSSNVSGQELGRRRRDHLAVAARVDDALEPELVAATGGSRRRARR